MLKRRKLVYLVIGLVLMLTFVQAFGNKVEDLKKEQKNLNTKIKEQKNLITDIENESKTVSQEIVQLDKKVDEASNEIALVEKDLENLAIEIVKIEEELVEAEERLEEQQETFNSRLRVMYMNGNVGYLELLLSSQSIKDFLSRKDMIKSIADHDKKLVQYMKEQRDIIDGKKIELQAQRASVQVAKSKLEARKNELVVATRAKEDLMARLAVDLKAAEEEYDKANEYAKKIEADIIKAQRVSGPYSGGAMNWPVPGRFRISSPYGYRIHPIFKVNKLHTGIDIPAPTGTAVTAAAGGTVIHSDWLGSYGKAIMVDHGGGIVTLYGHNSSLTVSKGATVKKGDTIAIIGNTGYSTGPHLHFEVRKNGAYVDPMGWLKGK